MNNQQNICDELIRIGILLYSEIKLQPLLEKILDASMQITHCEGGSIYIKEQDSLRFYVSRNIALENGQIAWSDKTLPIDERSLAGYVALKGLILNIADAYDIQEAPVQFNLSFDQEHHYRTRSVLMLPFKDSEQQIIGVLQLINAKNSQEEVISFKEEDYSVLMTLCGQAAIALKNTLLMQEIKEAYLDTIYRLAMAAELKDTHTFHHLKAVSLFSRILAKGMGLGENIQEFIEYASPMHDIGKIGIPDYVLKKEGPLDEEERRIMQQHTLIGARIFQSAKHPILQYAEEIALAHHERFDGKGYPYGISGDKIPISA